jgi:hypothetical protein
MITRSQKAKSPEAAGLFAYETNLQHGVNSTPADEKTLDLIRAELSRFGLAVRKVNPSGFFATCKQSTHFLRDFGDVTALCDKIVRGAEHTMKQAGDLPDSEVFSRSEFGHAAHGGMHGFGAGSAHPQGRQHGLFHVFKPSSTRYWLNTGASGFQVQQGTETMPIITVKKRTSVAPIATTSTELTAQARQRLQEAIGLLQGTPSEADTARALGRILTASRALKRVVGGAA